MGACRPESAVCCRAWRPGREGSQLEGRPKRAWERESWPAPPRGLGQVDQCSAPAQRPKAGAEVDCDCGGPPRHPGRRWTDGVGWARAARPPLTPTY
eukprot:scaffold109310_cov28-Tisochrysis_lutea.AAC.2